jgi:hypothetical protein
MSLSHVRANPICNTILRLLDIRNTADKIEQTIVAGQNAVSNM